MKAKGTYLLLIHKFGNKFKKKSETAIPALVRKILIKIGPRAIPGVEMRKPFSWFSL